MIASVSLSHARTKAGMSSIDVPPSLSLSVCRSVCPRHAGTLVKPSWREAFYFVCKEIGTCVTRSMITWDAAFSDCISISLKWLTILVSAFLFIWFTLQIQFFSFHEQFGLTSSYFSSLYFILYHFTPPYPTLSTPHFLISPHHTSIYLALLHFTLYPVLSSHRPHPVPTHLFTLHLISSHPTLSDLILRNVRLNRLI